MSSHLIESLGTTVPLAEAFSDRSILRAMLDFEAALARAEAAAGVIPAAAAQAITAAAATDALDAAAIARAARDSGTISIPFVKALTALVDSADASSGRFVHFGATSQDVADTAMVLTIRRARSGLAVDHKRLTHRLRELSDRHARTVMLGRTLLQPASPITFGLKVAGWYAALTRSWARFERSCDEACVLQFGGASGTLAALDGRGLNVSERLALELDLPLPAAPWHTERDRIAAVVADAGICTSTLGKIARDISLLMQDEVGEVSEPGGGSSTMPQKRNPSGCAVALAAAVRLPSLVSSFLTGSIQEHERGVGGWHAEWPTVAAALQATGSALASLAAAIDGLTVNPERMRANIERTNGTVFAERVVMLLAPGLGKETANSLISDALARCRESGKPLRDVLLAMPDVARAIPPQILERIDVAEDYLGSADALRVRLLERSASVRASEC
jgi:3-carboxy-cis,cis-muconate cycloisomerase